MGRYKEKLDIFYRLLGEMTIKRRHIILIVTFSIIGVLSMYMPKLRVVTTIESSFSSQNNIIKEYQKFRDRFGRDEKIIILIETEDVFNKYFLKKLKKFHSDLENALPLLNRVNSFVNTPHLKKENGSLKVTHFLDKVPETLEDARLLKKKALAYPAYKYININEKSNYAIVAIETKAVSALSEDGLKIKNYGRGLESADDIKASRSLKSISHIENIAIMDTVETIIKEYDYNNFKIYYSGTPVYQFLVEPILMGNMKAISVMVLVFTTIFMAMLFRRVSGTFLPQIIVVASLFATLGLMALLDIPFTSASSMLPSIILTVALPAPIHFMVVFFKYQKTHGRINAIRATLEHSGLPITMTALTTVAGLISFSSTDIVPVAHLGLFSAVGVTFSLIFTIFFAPALLAFLNVHPVLGRDKLFEESIYNRALMGLGRFGVRRSKTVMYGSVFIFLLTLVGIIRLEYSHNMLHYFSKNSDFMIHTKLIEKETGGTRALEVVIDTGKKNGIFNHKLMDSIEKLKEYALTQTDDMGEKNAGKIISITDIVKEINFAWNGNRSDFFTIPRDDMEIKKQLTEYNKLKHDHLKKYTDPDFSMVRFTTMMFWKDASRDLDFVNRIKKYTAELFGKNFKINTTGAVSIGSGVIESLMDSLIKGYLLAFFIITILMIISVGEVKLGLIAMIPNLLPVFVGLGIMGLAGIPLNTFNLIGGSIVIGIAVDDTIHFFHNFRNYYLKTGDVEKSVNETLSSAGRALMTTTLIFVTCFWLRLFNPLQVVSDFGLITGFSLLVAFFADVVLSPALLNIIYNKKNQGKEVSNG